MFFASGVLHWQKGRGSDSASFREKRRVFESLETGGMRAERTLSDNLTRQIIGKKVQVPGWEKETYGLVEGTVESISPAGDICVQIGEQIIPFRPKDVHFPAVGPRDIVEQDLFGKRGGKIGTVSDYDGSSTVTVKKKKKKNETFRMDLEKISGGDVLLNGGVFGVWTYDDIQSALEKNPYPSRENPIPIHHKGRTGNIIGRAPDGSLLMQWKGENEEFPSYLDARELEGAPPEIPVNLMPGIRFSLPLKLLKELDDRESLKEFLSFWETATSNKELDKFEHSLWQDIIPLQKYISSVLRRSLPALLFGKGIVEVVSVNQERNEVTCSFPFRNKDNTITFSFTELKNSPYSFSDAIRRKLGMPPRVWGNLDTEHTWSPTTGVRPISATNTEYQASDHSSDTSPNNLVFGETLAGDVSFIMRMLRKFLLQEIKCDPPSRQDIKNLIETFLGSAEQDRQAEKEEHRRYLVLEILKFLDEKEIVIRDYHLSQKIRTVAKKSTAPDVDYDPLSDLTAEELQNACALVQARKEAVAREIVDGYRKGRFSVLQTERHRTQISSYTWISEKLESVEENQYPEWTMQEVSSLYSLFKAGRLGGQVKDNFDPMRRVLRRTDPREYNDRRYAELARNPWQITDDGNLGFPD